MSASDSSAFLKIDTPANACTVSDRALREAFRASMDAPQEKAGLLDQLNARIGALKSKPKAAKAPEAPVANEVPDTRTPAVTEAEAPKDDEGTLFAHLNEIMADTTAPAEEVEETTPPARSNSIIVRAIQSLLPKKKAKAAPQIEAAPKPQSGSIILRLLSGLKPKAKATAEPEPAAEVAETPKPQSRSVILRALSALKPKPKAAPAPASEAETKQSGSVVIKLLKAISPIKRTA
ncbi:MAG: hypothetical protein AAGK92_08000 [Pseudomonadota bacterium]